MKKKTYADLKDELRLRAGQLRCALKEMGEISATSKADLTSAILKGAVVFS